MDFVQLMLSLLGIPALKNHHIFFEKGEIGKDDALDYDTCTYYVWQI